MRYYWKPVKPPTDTKTATLIATHKETATAITTIMEKAYFVMEDSLFCAVDSIEQLSFASCKTCLNIFHNKEN